MNHDTCKPAVSCCCTWMALCKVAARIRRHSNHQVCSWDFIGTFYTSMAVIRARSREKLCRNHAFMHHLDQAFVEQCESPLERREVGHPVPGAFSVHLNSKWYRNHKVQLLGSQLLSTLCKSDHTHEPKARVFQNSEGAAVCMATAMSTAFTLLQKDTETHASQTWHSTRPPPKNPEMQRHRDKSLPTYESICIPPGTAIIQSNKHHV
jgi:hypothetical protein